MAWVEAPPRSVISDTKVSTVTPVACSDLAIDSVDGQRLRPSGVMRFDLLNVVGSSPAFLARPEADKPARAASRSTAFQMSAWVSIVRWCATVSSGPGLFIRLCSVCRNKNSNCPYARGCLKQEERADTVPRGKEAWLGDHLQNHRPSTVECG